MLCSLPSAHQICTSCRMSLQFFCSLPSVHLDLETAIMHKLQNAILEKSEVLFTVMQYSAELDWYVQWFLPWKFGIQTQMMADAMPCFRAGLE